MINDNLNSLTRVKMVVNDITTGITETEIFKYLAKALVKYFGFSHVTIRRVDWEKEVPSFMCYLGFMKEMPTFRLPLFEEAEEHLGRL